MKITKGYRFIPHSAGAKKVVDAIVETTQDATEAVVDKVTTVVTDKVAPTTVSTIEAIENSQRIGILVTTSKRFFRISGIDLAGLLSLEFFTTLIPIMILGAGGLSGFSKNFNLGDAMVSRLGLNGSAAKTLHDTFPTGSDLKTFYTFFGLLSFLIWGIPLAIQVGRIFAAAYDSRRFTLGSEIARGTIWFALLLLNLSALSVFPDNTSLSLQVIDFLIRFGAVYIFWFFTPALLVRDGVVGIKFLMVLGAVGAIIDAIILPLLFKFTIPLLINSWDGFGSIGIAMTIATWCTVMSTAWVLCACFGGELAQRRLSDGTTDTLIKKKIRLKKMKIINKKKSQNI